MQDESRQSPEHAPIHPESDRPSDSALRQEPKSEQTPQPPPPEKGPTRREFVVNVAAASAGLAVGPLLLEDMPSARAQGTPPTVGAVNGPGNVDVTLTINGNVRHLALEPRVTLLDALRERLQLTGTKKGCDHGQCGSCTVHIDGQRTLSCLTFAIMHQNAKITTIEGLAEGDSLHPMQSAFIKHDAFQCGYCTPGQIMSAVGLIKEGHREGHTAGQPKTAVDAGDGQNPARTEQGVHDPVSEQIQEQMSGNICRCGAYPNIVAAVREVMEGGNASV